MAELRAQVEIATQENKKMKAGKRTAFSDQNNTPFADSSQYFEIPEVRAKMEET